MGLLALGLLGTLLSPGGSELYRFVMYGSFLAVPVVLWRILSSPWRRILFPAVFLLLLLTSLPTFFVHNNLVSLMADHPSEIAAGRFIEEVTVPQDLELFWTDGASAPAMYFSPAARFLGPPQATELPTVEDFRRGYEAFLDRFVSGESPYPYSLMLISKKLPFQGQHLYGIAATDPLWDEFHRLADQGSLLYTNGDVWVYGRPHD
jgi:hypothetical protein